MSGMFTPTQFINEVAIVFRQSRATGEPVTDVAERHVQKRHREAIERGYKPSDPARLRLIRNRLVCAAEAVRREYERLSFHLNEADQPCLTP
jgi:hypothetical protein